MLNLFKGRALLADEMGLGKTIQSIAYMLENPHKQPTLVICPASLKWNWADEIKMWAPDKTFNVIEGKNCSFENLPDFTIINYEILKKHQDSIIQAGFKSIICDEIHLIKNSAAIRTKATKAICRRINPESLIFISGTPVLSKPIEIWNVINLLQPGLFTWDYFTKRYCNAKWGAFGMSYDGCSNAIELNRILKNKIMIRRLKKDVMSQLPDKVYNHVHFELSNKWRKKYALARKKFVKALDDSGGVLSNDALQKMQKEMSVSFDAKLNSTIEWIESFLETGKKIILFGHHTEPINIMMEKFKDVAVKIDGSVPVKDRTEIVRQFNTSDKIQILVGNMRAAGVGLNMTGASDVAFFELPWTPADLLQCEDRAHRIGQTETVMVHFLIARGTVEEDLALMLDKRRNRFRKILDGETEDMKYRVSANLV
jgi:SWI/SNF-related matrix-associated actin-dependent regulator 1 of chromatin subfamily A